MPYSSALPRYNNGKLAYPPINFAQPTNEKRQFFQTNYCDVIASCYSWLWLVGLTGLDPLGADINKAFLRNHPEFKLPDVLLPSSELGGIVRLANRDVVVEDSIQFLVSRVDCPYSLTWLDEYIKAIEELIITITNILIETDYHVSKPHPDSNKSSDKGIFFRPSVEKKDIYAQALPKNLHFQTMSIRRANSTKVEVLDSVSCGCMSPHFLSSSKGGLLTLEQDIKRLKEGLNHCKQTCSNLQYTSPDMKEFKRGLYPNETSLEWNALTEVGTQIQLYEKHLLGIGKRKIFPLAQVVSIGVNAVMSKISLIVDGMIPSVVAETWLVNQAGFLLTFECLLTFLGKELVMIEDSASVISALRFFTIRILPSSSIPEKTDHLNNENNNSNSNNINSVETRDVLRKHQNDLLTVQMRRQLLVDAVSAHLNVDKSLFIDPEAPPSKSVASSKEVNANATMTPSSSAASSVDDWKQKHGFVNATQAISVYGLRKDQADISMNGREVNLYLSDEVLGKLPPQYKKLAYESGAVIKFAPILFTQGIDIQQSMVASVTSENNTLQHAMNVESLKLFNQYCAVRFPGINPTTTSVKGAGKQIDLLSSSYASLFPTYSKHVIGADEATAHGNSYLHQSSSSVLSSLASAPTSSSSSSSNPAFTVQPLLLPLESAIHDYGSKGKNVDMLEALEKACLLLHGARVTFCKSGKDRTGMAVTLCQSRQLGELFDCGMSDGRVLRDANVMREFGVRLLIAEKNIGRKNYSFNRLQIQFLPVMYRPPIQVCEYLMKKDSS